MHILQIPVSLLGVVAAVAIIGTLGVYLLTTESISAWHSQYASKKECVDFMKTVVGTTDQAKTMCDKIIPHE